MRKLYTVFILLCMGEILNAQYIYYQSFTAASFPAGWSPSDTRVLINNQAVSSGYSSSATSPPASGGNNVRFDNCAPSGQVVSLTASGVISTSGYSNIRVGFGMRKSNAWAWPMAFEYSTDGSNWNQLSSDITPAVPDNWTSTYFDLPADANNVSNLRFRFSFTTTLNTNCVVAAPNFRIDDFIVGVNASLPIELSDLSARLIRNEVLISWSTISETNNSHFVIERSPDGRVFSEIGRVNGAGTVREKSDYTFTDDKPVAGSNYYRLRQVDFDGRFSFSPVRQVAFGRGEMPVSIYPMPADDLLWVSWNEPGISDTEWTIFDTAGRQLYSGVSQAENSKFSIGVDALESGAYFLRLVSERHSWTQTIIKR